MTRKKMIYAAAVRAIRLTFLVPATAACWMLALAGCQPQAGQPAPAPSAENASASASSGATPEADAEPDDVRWWSVFTQGAKAGYQRVARRESEQEGRRLVKVETLLQLSLVRGGRRIDQRMTLDSVQTEQGELVRFTTVADQGGRPQTTTGRVEGDRLTIESATAGGTSQHSIPWTAGVGGFSAVDESLLRKPLQPGERRTLRHLSPVVNQVATVELRAINWESTRLLGETAELLRVEATTTLPDGQALEMIAWVDHGGEILKSSLPILGQELIRTTREIATSGLGEASFDLLLDTMVRIAEPLADPHSAQRIRYRVRIASGDPVSVFSQGPSQEVRAITGDTAEVTVIALRGDSQSAASTSPSPDAGAEYRDPNRFVQSDDPLVRRIAAQAVEGHAQSWPKAVALERFVHDYLTETDVSQALATAADVAASRSGDCTEHAVLLAALARASGIPARVAIGLVYVSTATGDGFAFHMWNELHIGGRWIPFDATLGQGGIGGGHLKLADSSLGGVDALAAFLPVVRVMGRLKIDVVDVQ